MSLRALAEEYQYRRTNPWRLVTVRRVSRRHLRLRYSLRDAVDLTVVSVEAGLGLDQAIEDVSREMPVAHSALSAAFGLVTLEIRAGKTAVRSPPELGGPHRPS